MELLKAMEKSLKLRSDMEKLDAWKAHLSFNNQPVQGHAWRKLLRAIDGVIEDIGEEHNALQDEIEKVTKGIEVNIKTK